VWLGISYVLLYGLVLKSVQNKIRLNIEAKRKAIEQVEEYINQSYINLDVQIHPILLCATRKIWDVTSENFENRVVSRASYSAVVKKREVRFAMGSINGLQSSVEALHLQNANGADLYIYPSFAVMYSSKNDFAIIGLHELNFYHSSVRFVEEGGVPEDSKIIDRTWAKTNKNGSPDKRFKNNYQIPVVQYGEINLSTSTGLHEQYYFSNYEASEAFAKAFREYQHLIKP
jgi:hypothetical protein